MVIWAMVRVNGFILLVAFSLRAVRRLPEVLEIVSNVRSELARYNFTNKFDHSWSNEVFLFMAYSAIIYLGFYDMRAAFTNPGMLNVIARLLRVPLYFSIYVLPVIISTMTYYFMYLLGNWQLATIQIQENFLKNHDAIYHVGVMRNNYINGSNVGEEEFYGTEKRQEIYHISQEKKETAQMETTAEECREVVVHNLRVLYRIEDGVLLFARLFKYVFPVMTGDNLLFFSIS